MTKKKGQIDWDDAEFRKFALKIAYIGTNYFGLARQIKGGGGGLHSVEAFEAAEESRSVEGELLKALLRTKLIKDVASCDFSRCGRTDRGVHSAGNFVALYLRICPKDVTALRNDTDLSFCTVLNGVLPKDIRVMGYAQVEKTFDARKDCSSREYRYFFPSAGLDMSKMDEAAKQWLGEHDFRNFCTVSPSVSHFRRSLDIATVKEELPGLGIAKFVGRSFLYHQIRSMMSVLMMIGRKLESPKAVGDLLNVGENPMKPSYELADPAGLVLYHCHFEGLKLVSPRFPPKLSPSECFIQSYTNLMRDATVVRCLAETASANNDRTSCIKDLLLVKRQSLVKHTPLSKRPRCGDYFAKLETLKSSRKMASDHHDE